MTVRLPPVPETLPPLDDDRHVYPVPAGTPLVRLHDTAGRHPRQHHDLRWFGPLTDRGRFDHHPPGAPANHHPDYGIVYAAIGQPYANATSNTAVDAVLSEAVQDSAALIVTDGLTLTVFNTADDLRLLDLRGEWAQRTRVGIHLSTAPHTQTQSWARAIRVHYPESHGLAYIPSTGGRATAVALNESTAAHLRGDVQLSRRITDPALLPIIGGIGHRLGFTLDTSPTDS